MMTMNRKRHLYTHSQSGIPIIGFAGWSGSGKTTLIEHLMPALKCQVLAKTGQSFRIGVVKHDIHGLKPYEEDRGTDSRRFLEAGADRVVLAGPGQVHVYDRDSMSVIYTDKEAENLLWQALQLAEPGMDLILIEGFKFTPIPQIGISRSAAKQAELPSPADRYLAIVTDSDIFLNGTSISTPIFTPEQIGRIAACMLSFIAVES